MREDNLGRFVYWTDVNNVRHVGRVCTQPTANPFPPFESPQEVRYGDNGVNDLGGRTLVAEMPEAIESSQWGLVWVATQLLIDCPKR